MSVTVAEGTPLTATTPGAATPALTYTLPLQGRFVVESVVADVDATAAGNVNATLRVQDKSGVVIATKRQGSPIPAGDTGSATWALRLADEAPAASSDVVLLWEYEIVDPFQTAMVRTNVNGPMAVDPLPQGFKTLEVFTSINIATIAALRTDVLMRFNDDVAAHYFIQTQELAGNPPAFNNSYIQGNGIFYVGAGEVNGIHSASMQAAIPGYSGVILNKAGQLTASGQINTGGPTIGVVQTIGFAWNPVTFGNPSPPIRRIRWETHSGGSVVDFSAGSYFAVYGRR